MNARLQIESPSRSQRHDHLIAELASRQHAVVSRVQLLELGLLATAIDHRLRINRLRTLHNGVYLVGPTIPDRATEMAAVLAGGPSAVLSHTSALHLWGLTSTNPPRSVHISVPEGGRGRRAGIAFHRVALADDERTTVDTIPTTTPARTLVDCAAILGSREIEHALATAERERLISAADLARLPDRYPRRRGVAMLRALIQDSVSPQFTRSEAERRCLRLLQTAGLPRPHTNVPVGPYELDLFWPEADLAVEIDGHAYHSSRSRFEGDRRKDNWLRARGIEVVRLTWRQITRDATATAVQVGQALALARARQDQTSAR